MRSHHVVPEVEAGADDLAAEVALVKFRRSVGPDDVGFGGDRTNELRVAQGALGLNGPAVGQPLDVQRRIER